MVDSEGQPLTEEAMRARLGRVHQTDERDWPMQKLHAKLEGVGLTDPDPQMTLQAAMDSGNAYYTTWPGIRSLWAWIKAHIHHKPTPTPTPPPVGMVKWADSIILDQGDFGTCVGNGWAGWGNTDPYEDNYNEKDARAIYYESTVIGGSPDNPDSPGGGQQGSTVRDGAKAMLARKRLTAYAFSQNIDDLDHWLDDHGPVVIGIDWLTQMFYPDATGLIKATGNVEGGHCVFINERTAAPDDPNCRYGGGNSWGTGWGLFGHFYLSRQDLENLLMGFSSPGEACFAAELPI